MDSYLHEASHRRHVHGHIVAAEAHVDAKYDECEFGGVAPVEGLPRYLPALAHQNEVADENGLEDRGECYQRHHRIARLELVSPGAEARIGAVCVHLAQLENDHSHESALEAAALLRVLAPDEVVPGGGDDTVGYYEDAVVDENRLDGCAVREVKVLDHSQEALLPLGEGECTDLFANFRGGYCDDGLIR